MNKDFGNYATGISESHQREEIILVSVSSTAAYNQRAIEQYEQNSEGEKMWLLHCHSGIKADSSDHDGVTGPEWSSSLKTKLVEQQTIYTGMVSRHWTIGGTGL